MSSGTEKKETIAAILTAWKRDHFEEQIQSLRSQTRVPDMIFVYQNKDYINLEAVCAKYGINKVYSNYNFNYFGRFAFPLALEAEYCLILDDDVIPGKRWIENCLRACREHNAIVGGAGRVINCLTFFDQLLIGDFPPVADDTVVDFIMHSYFFRTEWLRYMWHDRPFTFEAGEDIQFSAACRIYGGIRSVVPRQPNGEAELWNTLSPQLAHDQYSACHDDIHYARRKKIIEFWLRKGWKLQRRRSLLSDCMWAARQLLKKKDAAAEH